MAKKELKKESKKTEKFSIQPNTFIAIPASLTSILLGIIVMILIFSEGALVYLKHLIWGFVAMGFFAMFFAYKSIR
jgi:hypothetical protein